MISSDLHIHSNISDGLGSPELLVRHSLDLSIDVISITDHNTFRGSRRALEYVRHKRLPIIVLPGAEMRVKGVGDFLLYCPLPLNIEGPYKTLNELLEVSERDGCMLVPAHPLDFLSYGSGTISFDHHFKVIECFNSWTPLPMNLLTYMIAKSNKQVCLASSDAHVPSQVGLFQTIFWRRHLSSAQDVLDLLRNSVPLDYVMRFSIKGTVDRISWAIYRRVVKL